MFQIRKEEDAIVQLPQLLKHIGPDPILLILDDVWDESLPEKFEFDIPNYKILVTSSIDFEKFKNFRYEIPPLNEKDAMTLFCHSADLQDESSNIPEKDIKKVYMTKDIYSLCSCFFLGWVHNTKHTCQNYVSILTLTHGFNFAYFVSNNPTISNTY